MTYTKLASANYLSPMRSSRLGVETDTFLAHHMASTDAVGVRNAMLSGSKQVSANYIITSEGKIWGIVPEEERAWTSGSATDGGKGAAWDRRAITVEIENETGSPEWRISDKAIAAAGRLLADIRTRYRITNVLGHRDLYEKYGASYPTYCPGPNTVASIVAAEPAHHDSATAPEEEDEDMPIILKRADGKDFSRLDPRIGTDLKPGQSRPSKLDKRVNVFRGFEATSDASVAAAWGRTHCRAYQSAPITLATSDYLAAQREATRLSLEIGDK